MALVLAADAARYLEKERVGLRVVGELASLALDYFVNLPPAQQKPDRSLVSIADRNVELRARELLAQFDEASAHETGFIGEEFGAVGSLAAAGSTDAHSSLARAKGVWVLDPIDGTTCFLSRIPTWSVLLAYVENGAPQVGIVCFPALGEVFCASTGNGACYGSFGPEQRLGVRPPHRTFVRGTQSLKDAFVSYSSPAQFAFRGLEKLWISLGAACSDFRTVSDAFGYSRVLCGGIDAMIDVVAAPYDLAAVQVLFRETPGACFGSFFGDEVGAAFSSGGAVGASSPQIFAEYAKLLAESALSAALPLKSGKKFQGDWLGSDWLRGAFHRQTLCAAFLAKKTFIPDLIVTLNAAEWYGFGGANDALALAGWCLEITIARGGVNPVASAVRAAKLSAASPQRWEQAREEAEGILQEVCIQAYRSAVQTDLLPDGVKDTQAAEERSVGLLQSPPFLRQVDMETQTWEQLKTECQRSILNDGFLLVRQSVRKLDVRGMDTYEVKLRLGSVAASGLRLGVTEPSEVPGLLESLVHSTAPLSVPVHSRLSNGADASDVSAWIKVIQEVSTKLRT